VDPDLDPPDSDPDPDADPDLGIFVIELQDTNKNEKTIFLLITFSRYMYIIFSKIKRPKEVTKQ